MNSCRIIVTIEVKEKAQEMVSNMIYIKKEKRK